MIQIADKRSLARVWQRIGKVVIAWMYSTSLLGRQKATVFLPGLIVVVIEG
jgi:hypothetical protein